MGLTPTLKPVLPPDVERRLNEAPPRAVSEFLAEPYPLAAEQIEQYRERGFVKLEQVISGEALRYFREVIGYAVATTSSTMTAPRRTSGCTNGVSCRRSTWGRSIRRSGRSPMPSASPT